MTTNAYEGLPVQPGDLIAGKYRVEKILGAGAMGWWSLHAMSSSRSCGR